MPFLILLGIGAIWGGFAAYENLRTPAPPSSDDVNEMINRMIVGKSKREVRQILRWYK